MSHGGSFRAGRFVCLGLMCIGALLGLIALIAGSKEISGGILVPGQVKSSTSNIVLQHETGGVVAQVHVVDGAEVRRGQVLVSLSTRQLDHQIAGLQQQRFAIDAALARINALQSGAVPQWPAVSAADGPLLGEEQALHLALVKAARADEEQLLAGRQELSEVESAHQAKLQALWRQADLIKADLADQQRLRAKGLVAKNRLMALKREVARLDGQMAEVALSLQSAKVRFARMERAVSEMRAKQSADWAAQALRLSQDRLKVQHQLKGALSKRRLQTLRAPLRGWIQTRRTLSPQNVIRPGEPILTLVPAAGDQRVVVAVAPVQVSQIWAGQEVMMRFVDPDAGDGQMITGRVLRRSVDAITPPDGPLHYEVHIRLDHNAPAKRHLVTGAPVEVLIKTGDRTPFAILAAPIRNFFRRALRETEPGSFDPQQSAVASGKT